jgi:hypothetical protein
MVKNFGEGDGILLGISSVGIDELDYLCFLGGIQEAVCFVREVDDDEEADDADSACYAAFDDHDPYVRGCWSAYLSVFVRSGEFKA